MVVDFNNVKRAARFCKVFFNVVASYRVCEQTHFIFKYFLYLVIFMPL